LIFVKNIFQLKLVNIFSINFEEDFSQFTQLRLIFLSQLFRLILIRYFFNISNFSFFFFLTFQLKSAKIFSYLTLLTMKNMLNI